MSLEIYKHGKDDAFEIAEINTKPAYMASRWSFPGV
jgi:hypothetical protein